MKLNEVEATSIYYSNSGNLIVPLVTFILGKEWVLYGCVFMSVQLVFLWTHGKNTISREGKLSLLEYQDSESVNTKSKLL